MKMGEDVRISPHAVIVRPELVVMGNHIAIDAFVVITTALELGDYVHIATHCSIIGGAKAKLVMKDFSGFAAGCRIACASDDYKGNGMINPTIPEEFLAVTYSTVIMEKFATLGTNVVVHPGVTVGEGAVVGSCSLVTRDLDPWGIYVGVPAKRVGDRRKDKILEYAEILKQRGVRYEQSGGG
jgi:galactoside O-acetyltransferase